MLFVFDGFELKKMLVLKRIIGVHGRIELGKKAHQSLCFWIDVIAFLEFEVLEIRPKCAAFVEILELELVFYEK
jgi:hypothetical protein